MAGHRARLPHLAPVFGWASAITSFLLILVLVGDLFSTGGVIPMALNNVPMQEEFVASREQAVPEDSADTLPAAVGGMEEPASQSAEDADLPEIAAGEAAPEVAAASEAESAPQEETIPISKTIDMAAAEEPVEEEINTDVTFSAAPEFDTAETEKEAAQPDTGGDVLVEIASISETLEVESTPEQPVEAPPVEDVQPQAEEETSAQSPVATALSTELPPEPEPTFDTELPPPVEVSTTEKQGSLLIGTEVILSLFALGAGLAWVYLRRRGG